MLAGKKRRFETATTEATDTLTERDLLHLTVVGYACSLYPADSVAALVTSRGANLVDVSDSGTSCIRVDRHDVRAFLSAEELLQLSHATCEAEEFDQDLDTERYCDLCNSNDTSEQCNREFV